MGINKFFEVDFAIKVNASNERCFDRSTVIFTFNFILTPNLKMTVERSKRRSLLALTFIESWVARCNGFSHQKLSEQLFRPKQ